MSQCVQVPQGIIRPYLNSFILHIALIVDSFNYFKFSIHIGENSRMIA